MEGQEGGAAGELDLMEYRGFWLWEAHSVVFYEVMRLCGGPIITLLRTRVGPLKKTLTCVMGGEGGKGGGGVGFDECIEDSGSGRHILLCSTRF